MRSLVTTIYSFTNNTYKNRHLFIDNTTLIQFSRGCCRTKINYRYNDKLHKQNRVIYISVTATGITNGTDSLSPRQLLRPRTITSNVCSCLLITTPINLFRPPSPYLVWWFVVICFVKSFFEISLLIVKDTFI